MIILFKMFGFVYMVLIFLVFVIVRFGGCMFFGGVFSVKVDVYGFVL